MPVTERLKQTILERGLSYYRMALESGVPGPVLIRFCNGERGLRGDTIDKLAAYLGLELRPVKAKKPRR